MNRFPTKPRRALLALLLILCLVFSGCAGGPSDCSAPESAAPGIEATPTPAPTPQPGAGKAAVYLYLCGSTLETKNGAATKNIAELLGAALPADTQIVLQTGGAQKWREYAIPADGLTRYEIQNGALLEKQRLENASMGAAETLSDFIDYCVAEYPAEKTALILWDHGSGASGEVCYDENFGMDALTTGELAEALDGAHFDLLGFDACLLATNETASAAAGHADYMLASEEIEPSGGWDYTALAESFSVNAETEEIGKIICDAYLQKCADNTGGDMATLSLLDLKQYETFSAAFDAFASGLSDTAGAEYGNFSIVYAAEQAAKLGAAGRDEGASNLIDLYDLAEALSNENPAAQTLMDALDAFVPYHVGGAGRSGLGGVSLFFPQGYNSEEIQNYLALCSSEPYAQYLAGIYGDPPSYSSVFDDAGSRDGDGNFRVKLTDESRKYLKSVGFSLVELSYNENAEAHIEWVCLGEDNALGADWDNLVFTSDFRGTWLALDGVYLNYSVVESSRDHTLFSAPVLVNGERSNLRFLFVRDKTSPGGGYYKIIGLWGGLDENNLADKEIVHLQPGDEITVLQKRFDPMSGLTVAASPLSEGETVTIGENGGEIESLPLKETSQYRYAFIVEDIYGNRFFSNTASFRLLYPRDERLEHPLAAGERAAEIEDIFADEFWDTVG